MRLEIEPGSPESVEADVLAAPLVLTDGELDGPAATLDERLDGGLSRLASDGEATGKLNSSALLHVDGALRSPRVALAGIGAREAVDADALRTAAAAVVRRAEFAETVAWLLDPQLELPQAEQARAVVDGTILGSYDPGRPWKETSPRELERLVIVTEDAEAQDAAARAAVVAGWTIRARDLANEPPNSLTPEKLAAHAAEIAAGSEHLSAESHGLDEIRGLGMGAFAAVAAGSHNPAQLIVLRYDPPRRARDDVVLGLVGKAVTFDTGGISIKPALYMEDMKGDMAGGGAVIAALGAFAELELPLAAVGVVGATENAVGGASFRPGDILTAMTGTTIEVVNTDAEGRLILADALPYARSLGATHLVDLATLTGAMERALGDFYAGVFANDDDWRTQVVEAGEASGDHAWPWPLHPRYRRFIDSDFADLKNLNIRSQGVPVYAASFLEAFAGDGPWAHVDMAGTGFLTWPRHDYLWQRGGTGYGVRLLCELATRLAA
jgi:leucyl aminopeptidase